MIISRIKQGLLYIFGRYNEKNNDIVKTILSNEEFEIFNSMSRYDKIHSFRLYNFLLKNEILKDAALLFLNKEEAEKNWDIHMSYEEAKDLTREILIKSGYNKEFLEKVFEENKEE